MQRCEVKLPKVTQLVISGVESNIVNLAAELGSLTVARRLEDPDRKQIITLINVSFRKEMYREPQKQRRERRDLAWQQAGDVIFEGERVFQKEDLYLQREAWLEGKVGGEEEGRQIGGAEWEAPWRI